MLSKNYYYTKNIASAFDTHAEMMLGFFFFCFASSFRYFKVILKSFSTFLMQKLKMQIFVLKTMILQLLVLHQFKISFVKLTLVKMIQTLKLKFVTYKEVISKFFKNILKNRFYLYALANFSIIYTIIGFDRNDFFCVSFKGLHNKNYSVGLMLNYVLLKLDQYYTFNEIVFPLIRKLMKRPTILGFKFVVAGRLDRTERAIYVTQSKKSVPLTEKETNIDYAEEVKILRYGTVGIKFWLHLLNFLPSYYKLNYVVGLLLCLNVLYNQNKNYVAI